AVHDVGAVREAQLQDVVCGILPNLMLQPEASKIPLYTFAAYFQNPAAYDPDAAWEAALQHVGGGGEPDLAAAEALRRFGENSLGGCLGTPEAETLTRLAQNALAAAESAHKPDHVAGNDKRFQALEEYLGQLDAACY